MLAGWLWLATSVTAQATAVVDPPTVRASEAGTPLLRNFSPEDYGGYPQNWAVTQDRRGIIYVGNGDDGVLEFDGNQWRRIPVPNQSTVRSLAVDAHGRVYVGCVGDFGYLAPDVLGQMHYVSLMPRIAAADRNFADVWDIFATPQGIYFTSTTRIFRIQGEHIQTWPAQTQFHLFYWVYDHLYVREAGVGLLRLVEDKLVRVPGGERFANQKIYAMVPWVEANGHHSLLIGTRTHGWFVFDGAQYRAWPTRTAESLEDNQIYGAHWLTNGVLAVATLQGGVVLLDRNGNETARISSAQGLLGDTVYGMFQDREGGLWLALDNGIARADVDAALTRYTSLTGLDGSVMAIHRHRGVLYVGTAKGLFRLDRPIGSHARFVRVPGIQGQAWSMASMDASLMVATAQGVFEVDAQDVAHQRTQEFAFAVLRPDPHGSRILVGLRDGLASMRQGHERWIEEGKLPGIDDEIHALVSDAHGGAWLGFALADAGHLISTAAGSGGGSWRMERIESPPDPTGASRFLSLAAVGTDIRFGSARGIYRLDGSSQRLLPDDRFRQLFDATPQQVLLFREGPAGVWMYTVDNLRGGKSTNLAVAGREGYRWDTSLLQAMTGKSISAIYADPDGVTWFGAYDGLYRHSPATASLPAAPIRALLRMVSTHARRVLWAGAGSAPATTLRWADNGLRFDYAQPGFMLPHASRFQVRLEGMDEDWSDWSEETYRDYTNLREGVYRFRVRAREAHGTISGEADFGFRVLPPWYRSWWAYLTWMVLSALVVMGAVRWRSAALRRRNAVLRRLVGERTEALSESHRALERANGALVDQTITDALTGLKNRRYVIDHVEQDVAMVERNYRNLALGYVDNGDANINLLFVMMDLDHFKEVNDRYGHAAGDRVLAQLRDILIAATRESDTPVRWGGEEFLIISRLANDGLGPVVAERIRSLVEQHPFDVGNGIILQRTCSVGFASYPMFSSAIHRFNWEDVINIADQCLYRAKDGGRNRWVGVRAAGKIIPSADAGALPVDLDALVNQGYLTMLSSHAASGNSVTT